MNAWINEWLCTSTCINAQEGTTLKGNAYNEIYSGILLNCMYMSNDSLDNWRISLIADMY